LLDNEGGSSSYGYGGDGDDSQVGLQYASRSDPSHLLHSQIARASPESVGASSTAAGNQSLGNQPLWLSGGVLALAIIVVAIAMVFRGDARPSFLRGESTASRAKFRSVRGAGKGVTQHAEEVAEEEDWEEGEDEVDEDEDDEDDEDEDEDAEYDDYVGRNAKERV
jgi:hypothetical protein